MEEIKMNFWYISNIGNSKNVSCMIVKFAGVDKIH